AGGRRHRARPGSLGRRTGGARASYPTEPEEMSQTKHVEMRGVRKSYRFFTLDDLSLDLEPGQIMGFVGPNGAGKSTTIRLALGLLTPDAGEVRVLGHRMPDAQALAKRDVGYVADEMRLFPSST